MKKLLTIVLIFCACVSDAQYNRATQASNITTNIYQNATHNIFGSILQSVMLNQNNSYVNLLSDTLLLGIRNFSTSGNYTPGMGVFYGDSLFINIVTHHGAWVRAHWYKVIGPAGCYVNCADTGTGQQVATQHTTYTVVAAASALALPKADSNFATTGGPKYVSVTGFPTMSLMNSWSLTGNSGTVPPTDHMGTNDSVSLVFETNGILSGSLDVNHLSTSFGRYTLAKATPGYNNCAFGTYSLWLNTGNSNTAFGQSTLSLNITGEQNTAMGISCLQNNTTGQSNTASGITSMGDNTSGSYNSALGRNSLFSNQTGEFNTAVGNGAAYSTNASFVTAGGDSSIYHNLESYVTAIGFSSGSGQKWGSHNIYIGDNSGNANNSLSHQIYIGEDSLTLMTLKLNAGMSFYYNGNFQSGTKGQLLVSTGGGVNKYVNSSQRDTIFTPHTTDTINVVANYVNIINPASTIGALVIRLPSGILYDQMTLKFTQTVSAITFIGTTLTGGAATYSAGQSAIFAYRPSSWY